MTDPSTASSAAPPTGQPGPGSAPDPGRVAPTDAVTAAGEHGTAAMGAAAATGARPDPTDQPPLPEQRSGPPPAPVPTDHAAPTSGHTAEPALRPRRPHRRWRQLGVVVLVLALLASTAAAVYLYRTSEAWQERSEQYLAAGQEVGDELAITRAELAGARAEIEAVQAQLTTAQERIVQLADEKAQLGDDREVQRQTADYQERVSDAAGRVALALDQCVQGQNQLIGYLESQATAASAGQPAPYDAAELERYGTDVQARCQAATDANTALQRELAR